MRLAFELEEALCDGAPGLWALLKMQVVLFSSKAAPEWYWWLDLGSATLVLEFQLRKNSEPRLKYK